MQKLLHADARAGTDGLFDFQGLIVEHKAADKTTETKALFDGTPRPRELLQYDVILELWVD